MIGYKKAHSIKMLKRNERARLDVKQFKGEKISMELISRLKRTVQGSSLGILGALEILFPVHLDRASRVVNEDSFLSKSSTLKVPAIIHTCVHGKLPTCHSCGTGTNPRNQYCQSCSTRSPERKERLADKVMSRLLSLKGQPLSSGLNARLRKIIYGTDTTYIEAMRILFKKELESSLKKLKENDISLPGPSMIFKVMTTGDIPRCPICSSKMYFQSKHCVQCSPTTEAHKEAIRMSTEKNGGPIMLRPKSREKFRLSMLKHHNVEWSGQSEILRVKAADTLEERQGIRNSFLTPNGLAARDLFNSNPEKIRLKRIRYVKTMEDRYGKDWMLLFTEAMAKARYEFKLVILGRKEFVCQGYEPVALEWLHSTGVKAKFINVHLESFQYKDSSNNKRRYLPDIFVDRVDQPRWVIEVKSDYTAGLKNNWKARSMWRTLQLKSLGVHTTGEDLHLLICSSKRVILHIKNPHEISRREALRLYANALSRL